MSVMIRPERPGDEEAIHELTQTAFASMPYSSGTEGPIVRALRLSGDLTLSLVSEDDDVIIGHVAFSPVSIDGIHDHWFGLGPISVKADRRKQGIGKALIGEGLKRLKAMGARGCALIGSPDVYRSSGFEAAEQLSYGGLDRKYIQRIVFSGPEPKGALTYSPAFDVTE